MKKCEYQVAVTGDQFSTGYKTWHDFLPPEGSAAIAAAANGLLNAVKRNVDPNGDLTVTLSATIDGVAQPDQVFKTTRRGLGRMEKEAHIGVGALLDATEKHHGKKQGK